MGRYAIVASWLLLLAASASAATVDFEASTLGDDLAQLDATYAGLGVDFDAANPPVSVIADPDNPGQQSLQATTLPSGADILVNFDQAYDFVSVRFPNEPTQLDALVSVIAYDHTGTAGTIQGSGGVVDNQQATEPGTVVVRGQGIRAVQLELNGNPVVVDDITFEQLCGNGVIDAPEECDDGGQTPGDGCDAACLVELDGWEASGGLPDADCPAWMLIDTADPEEPQLAMGLLTLSTSADAENMDYILTAPDLITPPSPFVLEARLRFVSGSSSSVARAPINIGVTMGPDHKHSVLHIDDGEIFLTASESTKGPSAAVATSDGLHTYRVVVDTTTGVIDVWYDGAPVLTGATFANLAAPSPRLFFGEGSVLANGVSEWEYVRHNAGVCVPPTTTTTTVTTTTTTTTSSTTLATATTTSTSTSTSTTQVVTTTTTSVTTTLPPADATLVPGKKLLVKQKKSGEQRLQMLVKDAAVAAAAPCEVDGELVIEALGASAGVQRFPLDASLWKPIKAKRPEKGCKYRKGPVAATVLVKTGKSIKVIAQASDLGIPLTTDPRPLRIEVRQGDVRHCVEFGGQGRHKIDKKLLARGADLATACPSAR